MYSSEKNKTYFGGILLACFVCSATIHAFALYSDQGTQKLNVKPLNVSAPKKATNPSKTEPPKPKKKPVEKPQQGATSQKPKKLVKQELEKPVAPDQPKTLKQALLNFEAENNIILRNIPNDENGILSSGMSLLYLEHSDNRNNYFVKSANLPIKQFSMAEIDKNFGRNIVLLDSAKLRGKLLHSEKFNPATSNVGLLLGVTALQRIVVALEAAGINVERMHGRQIELSFIAETGKWELVKISKRETEAAQ